ncbi:MAG: hypothetical protein QNJ77_11900 [Acidimicrobiia bacterium]|nr:hypothetical protein [Acidimicrobiia bacterium]
MARRGRSELEDDTAAAEHDTELLRRRRRSLTDVCFEWMSRGDLVSIGVADRQFEGQLVAAVNDLLVLETRTARVAINVSTLRFARSERRGAFTGTTGERGVSSFRADLGRYEIEGKPVRLIGREPGTDLTGVIVAATEDHVLLRNAAGLETVVPRSELACAIEEATKSP